MNKNPKNKKAPNKLEKKFQQLGKEAVIPEDLKKEVFNTLDTVSLFADIVDLFTVKFSMTEIEALGMATEEIESKSTDTEKKEIATKTEAQPKKDK